LPKNTCFSLLQVKAAVDIIKKCDGQFPGEVHGDGEQGEGEDGEEDPAHGTHRVQLGAVSSHPNLNNEFDIRVQPKHCSTEE
jgi:hypothetical protein